MKNDVAKKTGTGKKKKILLRILRILAIVAISLVIGIGVYIFNARRLMGNELPMPFGFGLSVVLTGSMEPTLNVNDLVIVVPSEEYVPNEDIIVFQDGRSLVIHRLIEINEETALTKGDANNASDEPIKISQIKGKMTFRVPFVGAVVRFLQSPVGIILVLGVSVFLFVLSGRKEKEKAFDETDEIRKQIEELKRLMESKENSGGDAENNVREHEDTEQGVDAVVNAESIDEQAGGSD